MDWIDFPNDGFNVHGLAWFEEDRPALRRLPERLSGFSLIRHLSHSLLDFRPFVLSQSQLRA